LKREKDQRVKQKLSFLYLVGANGSDFSKAVEAIGIDVSTGYKWVKRWNKGGYEALLPSKNKGGRPPKLSKDDLEDLREKLKMRLSKPYPHDYRRPEDAERILKERIERRLKKLEEEGYNPEEVAIGFIDESSPQNTANTVGVWSFDKPTIKKHHEDEGKRNRFLFH